MSRISDYSNLREGYLDNTGPRIKENWEIFTQPVFYFYRTSLLDGNKPTAKIKECEKNYQRCKATTSFAVSGCPDGFDLGPQMITGHCIRSSCNSTDQNCDCTFTTTEETIGCGNNAILKKTHTLTMPPRGIGTCNMPNYSGTLKIGDKTVQESSTTNPCFTSADILENRRDGDGNKSSKYLFTKSCTNCSVSNDILTCKSCLRGGAAGGVILYPKLKLNTCELSYDEKYKKNIPSDITNTRGDLNCTTTT